MLRSPIANSTASLAKHHSQVRPYDDMDMANLKKHAEALRVGKQKKKEELEKHVG